MIDNKINMVIEIITINMVDESLGTFIGWQAGSQNPYWPETCFPDSSTLVEHQAFVWSWDQLKVQLLNIIPLYMNGKMQVLFEFSPLTVVHDAFLLVSYPERKRFTLG